MNWRRISSHRLVSQWTGKSWRSMHSPTLFRMARALQENPKHWPEGAILLDDKVALQSIRALRSKWRVSSATLEHHDHGAGSRVKRGTGQTNRAVAHLARHVLTQESDAEAMARWLRSLNTHGKVLELGTSLGLTAMHFVRSGWDVETWEGCPNTMAWARSGWQSLGVEGFVRSRVGTFQSMLEAIDEHACWDVVFLDGHHEGQATRHLVDALAPRVRHALVVDDIAWSEGMHEAWMAVQDSEDWRVSVVWRGRGILLKAPHMVKQRVCLA